MHTPVLTSTVAVASVAFGAPLACVTPIRRILAVTAAAYGLDPAVDHRRGLRRGERRQDAANKRSARRSA